MNKRQVFTYFFPIVIILNGYSSGIQGLSLGALLMNMFNAYALLAFFKKREKTDAFIIRTILLLYTFFFLSCVSYLIYGIDSISKTISGVLKIFTWFMGVTFTARELFDYELFKPFFRKFCVFCTIYLFLQMFFWNAGRIYLPNVFDFGIIKPMYEQYSAAKYIKYLTAIGFGRFSSFFAEPAYYGIMMIINLIILVFDIYYPQGLSNEAKIETLFIILGIWVSTSTAAIVFVVAIVLVYFVKTNMSDKFLLIIVAVSVGMFLISSAESNILGSFFISKLTQMGESGRVGASYAELDNLSTLQLIFGVGMNNEGVITESLYFNVFTGLIIEYGVLGFSIFLLYLYKIYETSDNIALHILIIIYMAAMFQGGYLFNLYGILFLSIAQNLGYKKLF